MAAGLAINSSVRRGALVVVATAVLILLARLLWPLDPPAPPRPEPRAAAIAPQTWAGALARADLNLAQGRELARSRGGEWLVQEKIASAAMARARLTGAFDDYAAAEAALAQAFAATAQCPSTPSVSSRIRADPPPPLPALGPGGGSRRKAALQT